VPARDTKNRTVKHLRRVINRLVVFGRVQKKKTVDFMFHSASKFRYLKMPFHQRNLKLLRDFWRGFVSILRLLEWHFQTVKFETVD